MRLPTFSIGLLTLFASTISASSSTPSDSTAKLIFTLPPTIPTTAVPSSSHATLSTTNLTVSAPFTRSGTFEFHLSRLPPDDYLVDVWIRDYTIVAMKVVITTAELTLPDKNTKKTRSRKKRIVEVSTTFRGREWTGQGESLGGSNISDLEDDDVRIELRVVGMRSFYEERAGFSPLSLLKNPMILIGIAGLAMVVGMPKLLENMDPEMREEFERAQKASPLAAAASGGGMGSGFDVAGFLAGSSSSGGAGNGRGTEVEGGKEKGNRRKG